MPILRHLDVVVLLLALPVFVAGGYPLLGWGAAAVGWVAQKLVQSTLEARAAEAVDARHFFRFMAGSLIGRAWLLVVAILAVGLVEREAGLAAAILAGVVFTSYLALSLVMRAPRNSTDTIT